MIDTAIDISLSLKVKMIEHGNKCEIAIETTMRLNELNRRS